jgi:hypothetical protein
MRNSPKLYPNGGILNNFQYKNEKETKKVMFSSKVINIVYVNNDIVL